MSNKEEKLSWVHLLFIAVVGIGASLLFGWFLVYARQVEFNRLMDNYQKEKALDQQKKAQPGSTDRSAAGAY